MLRKKVFLYVSFVKSVQFVCAIILRRDMALHFEERIAIFATGLARLSLN